MNKFYTEQDIIKKYADLKVSKSLDNLEEHQLNEIKKYFAKQISKKVEKDQQPLIDITTYFINEYLIIFDLIKEGYHHFVLKGSRGSGKSTFASKFILIDMLLDYRFNGIAIMETKMQHSDTTMQDMKDNIKEIDGLGPGFESEGEFKDNQSMKQAGFRHNGKVQMIKFVGLDELSKGTFKPPVHYGVGRGAGMEEPSKSNEQFGADMESKREKFKTITTLIGGVSRFFSRLEKDETHIKFLQFGTFNPYNNEDPALDNFNKYHPDNKEELMKYGFTGNKNEELGEVYITSNYRVNPFLPQQFIDGVIKPALRIGGNDEKVLVGGITGSPTNSLYANIFHIMDKEQENTPYHIKEKGYTGFRNFGISIDVGNGGDGEMTIGLLGKRMNGDGIPLDAGGSKDHEKRYGYDAPKLVVELGKKIEEGSNHYVDFAKMKRIPIVMDNDIYFKSLFIEQATMPLNNFRLHLNTDKYKTEGKTDLRPGIMRYLLTSGILKMYEAFTEELGKQFRSKNTDKNGKVLGGNDDYTDMLEQGCYHIAKELGRYQKSKGKLLNKNMIDFMRKEL